MLNFISVNNPIYCTLSFFLLSGFRDYSFIVLLNR
uniref:Uncharacterized protein n=1 Tax=Siphoviridae sp. ctUcA20 TaxID=2825528 RepID=A0A8S5PPI0_9CAUD|nr:MAG TPA: hypothetical protein [Siphoviridae sp. ctUcA20]